MRLVRGLIDLRLFDATGGSDLHARLQLQWLAVECLIRRARLRYLVGLIRSGPVSLVSLLATTGKRDVPERLPWIALVFDDLSQLWLSEPRLAAMPDPRLAVAPWVQLMRDYPGPFHTYIDVIFFAASSCDAKSKLMPVSDVPSVHARTFACEVCQLQFSSEKACLQHCRVKHKMRCYEAQFVDSSGVCPVCRTVLHTRLRVLRHLCDPRRNKPCRQALRDGKVPAMSAETLARCEVEDKLARAHARREGRIHPQAVMSARRSSGLRCGRAAAA